MILVLRKGKQVVCIFLSFGYSNNMQSNLLDKFVGGHTVTVAADLCCYLTSLSNLTEGQSVPARILYHNTSGSVATRVRAKLSGFEL